MHNDSTSVSVHGQYTDADGAPVRGKPTAAVTFGHSKDHRPDLKQLVWILTVSADGSVPMAYRLADGNTNDDPTHVPTWDGLVKVLARRDFLYVADSKLCSGDAMRHIDGEGGRFVTVLPRTRGEDKWFRDWIQTNRPQWTEAVRLPGKRIGDYDRVWSTFPAPLPSAEGFRIVWVHSTSKAARDEHVRRSKIEAGVAAIDALNDKLAGPKTRLKTRAAVEAAVTTALAETNSARWLQVTVTETEHETFRQEKRGRPGANTRFRRTVRTRYTLTWRSRDDIIAYDAASDGCFPLITNDPAERLPDAQVLVAYRYQPNLERRHHLLKACRTPTRSGCATPPASKPSSAASSSPCSSEPSSNARSATPCAPPTPTTSPSTPNYAPAKHPPPNGSSPSSPTSPATSYTATGSWCKPSKSNSPHSSTRSSTCSTSPPPPTPPMTSEGGGPNQVREVRNVSCKAFGDQFGNFVAFSGRADEPGRGMCAGRRRWRLSRAPEVFQPPSTGPNSGK